MCPVVQITQNSRFYLILTECQNISPCVLRKPVGSCAPWPGWWLRGRTTQVLHSFAFCLGTFLWKPFPCHNHKGWGKEEKTQRPSQWNRSRIRQHKPHIEEIKLNLWKGPAEKAGGLQNELQQLCFGWPTTALPLAAAGSALVNKTDY